MASVTLSSSQSSSARSGSIHSPACSSPGHTSGSAASLSSARKNIVSKRARLKGGVIQRPDIRNTDRSSESPSRSIEGQNSPCPFRTCSRSSRCASMGGRVPVTPTKSPVSSNVSRTAHRSIASSIASFPSVGPSSRDIRPPGKE